MIRVARRSVVRGPPGQHETDQHEQHDQQREHRSQRWREDGGRQPKGLLGQVRQGQRGRVDLADGPPGDEQEVGADQHQAGRGAAAEHQQLRPPVPQRLQEGGGEQHRHQQQGVRLSQSEPDQEDDEGDPARPAVEPAGP